MFLQASLTLLVLQVDWLYKKQSCAAGTYPSLSLQLFVVYTMVDANSVEKGAYVRDSAVSPSKPTVEITFEPAAERRLLRKLDFRILPVLWILYLVNFIDR